MNKYVLQKKHPRYSRNDFATGHAIIVLPPHAALQDLLTEPSRWLARGQLSRVAGVAEPLAIVLTELGESVPGGGLAALRLWGQTGARPDDWLSAADPVCLEAMLDHVRLHALDGDALSSGERSGLFELLQQQMGEDRRKYLLIGEHAYLRGGAPFATAQLSSHVLDACELDDYLPIGHDLDGHDRLIGELQLLLHEAAINRRRDELGLMPINSIWFWGGGMAPAPKALALPPLIADDPLFRGYWHCASAQVSSWPDDPAQLLRDALSDARRAVVAVLPATSELPAAAILPVLRRQLASAALRRLTLVFRDGCLLRLSRWQLLAFWRDRAGLPRQGTVQ